MKCLIWIPALKETIKTAHKIESETFMLDAARKYVESINYPDSLCSVVIIRCSDDWVPIEDALQMDFKLIKKANFDSMCKYEEKKFCPWCEEEIKETFTVHANSHCYNICSNCYEKTLQDPSRILLLMGIFINNGTCFRCKTVDGGTKIQ